MSCGSSACAISPCSVRLRGVISNDASDIDILLDLQPDAPIGVFEYVGLTQFIADLFPVRVDVANHAKLKLHVRPHAEREAIYAF